MMIGFDGSRAFVKDKTGTENYSYHLLKHLAQIDRKNTYKVFVRPDTTVIPAPDQVRGKHPAGIQSSDNIYGSPPHSSSVGPRSGMTNGWPANFQFVLIDFPRLWTQAGLALQTFTDNIDILFVPAHTLPIIRRPGLKTVMTVHDLGAQYLPTTHQFKQRLYLGYITKHQLNSASALIAVSQSTKNDLIKEGIKGEKVHVIYEGFDPSLFKKPNSDIQDSVLNQFDLEKRKYFLFVGTIQPRKNLGNLIKAFKGFLNMTEMSSSRKRGSNQIPGQAGNDNGGIKLVLAGGKGWLSDEIFTLPKKLGIEEKVKFLGRVKDEELPTLYSGALALTYPSLYEGFGLPVLEAMACGCPVIASNTSSLPEVIGEAGILVDPLSVEEILEALVQIAENNSLRDNLIQKGNVQVKKFSWERCAVETLKLFSNLKS